MNRVAAFVGIAFAISWAVWLPLVVGISIDHRTAWLLYCAGVVGPAAAAFWSARDGERQDFHRRLRAWRTNPRWYAIAILLPFAIHGAAIAIAGEMRFRPPAEIARTALLALILVPFEEIGWRGYLLPALQRRYAAASASMIIAFVWATWHLPLAFADIGYQRSERPWSYMLRFLVTIVPISFLMTWLFNRSNQSVPIASLFHVAVNMADYVFAVPEAVGRAAGWIGAAIGATLAVAIWKFDRGNLSHA